MNATGTSILANAPGYIEGGYWVNVRYGAIEIVPETQELTVGQPTILTLRSMDPYDQYYDRGPSAVTSQQTFTLTSTDGATYQAMDGTPITTISLAAGQFQVQYKIIPAPSSQVTFGITGNANFTDFWDTKIVNNPAPAATRSAPETR
jgi:hypothetical protein